MMKTYASLAAVAVAALLGGGLYATLQRNAGDPFGDCIATGVIRGSDAFGGPFALVDHSGRSVTDAEVLTRPSLIYFGYTFCPDICPLDAARNAAAVDLLAERGHSVQPVFVTVDPQRDTPEVLADFVGYLHPQMIGLTGSAEQVRDAAAAYRAVFSRGTDEGDGFYLMNHTAFTYLHLPGQGVVAIFNPALDLRTGGEGVTEETVVETTACILNSA